MARPACEASLEMAVLEAHARSDHRALVVLYTEAADAQEAAGEIDQACFYLTHAFVFALQEGMPEANHLQSRLAAYEREAPPSDMEELDKE